jgi:hypothetical protein
MKTTLIPAILLAGHGFDVGQDFGRAALDMPADLDRSQYAKPGCVIAYIDANPASSLGFLKYGDRNGKIRIHAREQAFKL